MLQKVFLWTEANVGILVQMASDHSTAAEVSERIGCTRSAVLGKAQRLGIAFGHNKTGRKPVKAAPTLPKQVQQKKTAWTEERIEQASALWCAGHTAIEVAKVVGSTVGGFLDMQKRYRERFPKRAPSRIQAVPHVSFTKRPQFTADSVPFLLPEFPGVRFIDLKAEDCRFPVSNDSGPDMLCCGAKKTHGSYCGVHAMVARGRGTRTEQHALEGRVWR